MICTNEMKRNDYLLFLTSVEATRKQTRLSDSKYGNTEFNSLPQCAVEAEIIHAFKRIRQIHIWSLSTRVD